MNMALLQDGCLLRVFVGEADKFGSAPLYEAIVTKAMEAGLAGATVFRGPLGFGRTRRVHTAKILRLSEDLPMIIEIVDTNERIQDFLLRFSELISRSVVETHPVRILVKGAK